MSRTVSERDWKVFRELHRTTLQRLCDKILSEARAAIDERLESPHDKYIRLFKLIQARDRDIAYAFDDLRRSTAFRQISIIHAMDLFTPEELQRFSNDLLEALNLSGRNQDNLNPKGT